MNRVLMDSGIKWIGTLPNTWSITTVNKIFYRRKEVNDVENPTVLSLARDGVKIRDISTNEGQLAESYDNYHKVYKDDLMINPMDLISGANCSLSEVEGVISPAYINLAKKENIYPKYFDYFFKYQYWINAMFIHGKGVSFDNRWTLNWETMSSYKLPLPSFEEQKKIANYLDKQCAKINEIMNDNNREISLLEEYKKSIIDNMIFNDSEIHQAKLSRVFRFSQGTQVDLGLQSDIKNEKYQYRFLRIIDFTQGNVEPRYVESKYNNYLIKKDEIALVRYGASAGFVCRNLEGVLANNMFKLNKIMNIDNDYIYYFFNSNRIIDEMIPKSTAMPALDFSTMYNIKMPIFDLDKQKEICKKLNYVYAQTNKVISYRKQIIQKLEEYKRSLIYECVTGKREV